MAILNQKRILNLIPKVSAPVTIHVSQGDVGTEIEFTLVKGDEVFVNPGNVTASVHGVREDGANFGAFTCTLSGSKVIFPLHSEMTAVKGSALAEIVLVDNGGNKVGSANFGILVEESVFPLGVTYDNDVSVYESILAYVQTIPAQVEADITSAVAQEASARQAADAAFNTALATTNSNLSGEISARISADALINTRIDEIIAPSGEAPSAAEVTDARIGADGVTYNTLGNAIRGQVTDLKSAFTYEYSISDSKESHTSATWNDTFLQVVMPAGFYRCELTCSDIGSVFLVQLQSAESNASTYTVKQIMSRAQAISSGVVEFEISAEESQGVHYVNIVNYTSAAYTVSCTITNLQNEKLADIDVALKDIEILQEDVESNQIIEVINEIDLVSRYQIPAKFKLGQLNNSTGEEVSSPSSSCRITNFLALPPNDLYFSRGAYIFYYDENKDFLTYTTVGAYNGFIATKHAGRYFRLMVTDVTDTEPELTLSVMRKNEMLFAAPMKSTINLLDVSHIGVVQSKVLTSVGSETSNSDYLISWFIPVTPGITYYIAGGGSSEAYNVFYDSDLNILSTTSQKTITAPSNAAFLRCSILKNTADQAMVKTTDDSAFVPYGETENYDYYYYVPDLQSFTSNADLVNIRVSGYRSSRPGYIDSIYARCSGAGSVDFYIISGVTVLYKFTANVIDGTNRFINGVDFTYNDILPVNTRIGIQSATVNIKYGADGYASNEASNQSSASVGDRVSISGGKSYDISVGFTFKRLSNEAEEIDSNNRYYRANKTAILVKDSYEYYLDADEINLKFTGSSGLLKIYHTGAYNIECGSMIVIDIDNWNLIFAKAISQQTMANYQTQSTQSIGLTYVSGRTYAVKYEHTIIGCTVTITDTTTRDSVSYTNTNSACGEMQGKVGYSADSGITVTDFTAIANNPFDAKALIIGDSYTAGYTMWGQKDKRWCSLYADEIGDKVFLNAMGGASTVDGLSWLTYAAELCHPEYVIIELGVNDSSVDAYKTNINAMLDYVKNYLHAKPVLVVIPKTTGAASSSIYASIDSFVKSSGEKYIDMLTPLTVNGDGETQNLDLFFADKVHPNVAGHQAIFEQMKIDMPELFVNY